MGRRRREDWPGAWHHVFNRGIARRPVFESGADVAEFLRLMDRSALAGDLEVHAYAILTTHFHLLVRSPRGRLPVAMRDVQNRYVRGFNRGRRRDGPLFRSRYSSRTVESDAYWRTLLRYIDRNPVAAGLCQRSIDYPHGSAWWYARSGGPPCLRRVEVEAAIAEDRGRSAYHPADYPLEARGSGGAWVEHLIEGRARAVPRGADPLQDLVRAGAAEVQEWMLRKSRLADGTVPGWVIVSPEGLREAVARCAGAEGSHRSPRDLLVPMLHLYCGLSQGEAGEFAGVAACTVHRRTAAFVRGIERDADLRQLAAEALRHALAREAGAWRPGRILPHRVPTGIEGVPAEGGPVGL